MQSPREYHSFADVRRALGHRPGALDDVRLFDRLDWMESLHRHCFADVPLRVIHATQGQSDAWLFLLAPTRGRLEALANYYSFAFAPVVTGAPDPAARRAMLQAMGRHLRSSSARMSFYPLEDCAELRWALGRAGWWTVRRTMGGRHLLSLDGRDFATYWRARPGRLRNLVRRKGRGDPFTLTIHDRMTPDLWDDYVAVQARSWKSVEPEGGLDFLRDLAERESAAGTLRLGFARQGGQAVATQLWTIDRGVALIHKLAHDKAFDTRSPGTLLSHAMFRHAIDQDRVTMIDYGTGDNGYKTDWMERRIPLTRVDAFNPRAVNQWPAAVRAMISALVG
ncbi:MULTISPECIES: GNAT family N-acetyltransferase [Sphingobium]|uniref:GNAT family N-acetyltransferase n=1 Tax=Sphingobium TaxID=165695 RepID=UPI000C5AA58E|nr:MULTISPECIES: GNAT family N-acetyltransferase [Sphingobium]MBA38284.1 CelD-like protein [Sphingobium sp.]MBS46510.1 CelD-like protein [Sphingobium sp.]MCC4258496.1 GNAT family N-acetyltransferase [Sphingobium lactosutens]MEC9017116.1 GNAT family N-acetyltransferase [Pseudomonadota bacterium]